MTPNEAAQTALEMIRDIALSLYPMDTAKVDERYLAAVSVIAGLSTEALTAVHDGRPVSINVGPLVVDLLRVAPCPTS